MMIRTLLLLFIALCLCWSAMAQKTKPAPAATTTHLDSLNHAPTQKELILDQKLQDASQTINYLNSIIGSFGQILTILGIFIAVVALALPIIMYQFGIKPSQRALKELQKDIDSRMSNYLKDSREKAINLALENISTGTAVEKMSAVNTISLNHHDGLTDQQLFKIYTLLTKTDYEITIKNTLAFVLTYRKNDYADQLFTTPQALKDSTIKTMAYVYFAKMGVPFYRDTIVALINGADEPASELTTVIIFLSQYSSTEVVALINDELLINKLRIESPADFDKRISYILKDQKIPDDVVKESYLKKKIDELISAQSIL